MRRTIPRQTLGTGSILGLVCLVFLWIPTISRASEGSSATRESALDSIAESLERLVELQEGCELDAWVELYRITLERLAEVRGAETALFSEIQRAGLERRQLLAALETGRLSDEEATLTLEQVEGLEGMENERSQRLVELRQELDELSQQRHRLEQAFGERLTELVEQQGAQPSVRAP